jgi:hypothetical protein
VQDRFENLTVEQVTKVQADIDKLKKEIRVLLAERGDAG